ncbi:unnamed protein product [Effrenium voratum]|nr:unnamed protein product [Effrenium voratum]
MPLWPLWPADFGGERCQSQPRLRDTSSGRLQATEPGCVERRAWPGWNLAQPIQASVRFHRSAGYLAGDKISQARASIAARRAERVGPRSPKPKRISTCLRERGEKMRPC